MFKENKQSYNSGDNTIDGLIRIIHWRIDNNFKIDGWIVRYNIRLKNNNCHNQ